MRSTRIRSGSAILGLIGSIALAGCAGIALAAQPSSDLASLTEADMADAFSIRCVWNDGSIGVQTIFPHRLQYWLAPPHDMGQLIPIQAISEREITFARRSDFVWTLDRWTGQMSTYGSISKATNATCDKVDLLRPPNKARF
jgi:hypothetical protein